MRYSYAIIALLLLTAACAKIDYIGDEYPPTQNVDLYYTETDVKLSYIVIGHIVASGGELVSMKKIRKELIKKARKVGADGVIIQGLDRYRGEPTRTYKESTTSEQKGGKQITTTISTESISSEEIKEIKAVFIRYR
jgi:hypothetical protein